MRDLVRRLDRLQRPVASCAEPLAQVQRLIDHGVDPTLIRPGGDVVIDGDRYLETLHAVVAVDQEL